MKYDERTKIQQQYIDSIVDYLTDLGTPVNVETFTRNELREVSNKHKGSAWIPNWITHDQSRRASRGVFYIPEVAEVRKEDLPPTWDQDEGSLEIIGARSWTDPMQRIIL